MNYNTVKIFNKENFIAMYNQVKETNKTIKELKDKHTVVFEVTGTNDNGYKLCLHNKRVKSVDSTEAHNTHFTISNITEFLNDISKLKDNDFKISLNTYAGRYVRLIIRDSNGIITGHISHYSDTVYKNMVKEIIASTNISLDKVSKGC